MGDDLRSQFSKEEFLELALEIGLKFKPTTNSGIILKDILKDLDENGVPDPTDPESCTDLMFEFLVAAEYCDKDGNILEEGADDSLEEKSPAKTEVKLPECFTFADERDPACNRCKVFDMCSKARVESRPECFGINFDEHAPECTVCLEAMLCKKQMQGK